MKGRVEIFSSKQVIPKSLLESVPQDMVPLVWEDALGDTVISVEKRVVGTHPVYVSFYSSWPATWWQHFKQDVIQPLTRGSVTPFGKWLDRWANKVRRTEHEREQTVYQHFCPHIETPDKKAHMEFLLHGPHAFEQT